MTKIPECALVGKSNVGKSSLINFLSGQKKLAYVSQTPGRTQTINIFSANNGALQIADLPGYGFSKSPSSVSVQWSESMKEYFEKRRNLCCVFFLVDVRRDLTQEDRDLSRWFQSLGLKVIGVQTKCDKASKSEIAQQKNNQSAALLLKPDDMISISVYKNIGLENLMSTILTISNHSS